MPTKTISLRIEAYEKLRRARRYPGESFSEVVLRATWPEDTITGNELRDRYRRHGSSFFEPHHLDRIEELKQQDRPPDDKWREA